MLKAYARSLRANIGEFLEFEILFKLFTLALGYPVLNLLLKQGQRIAGTKYFTLDVAIEMIQNPKVVLLLILGIAWVSIFAGIELSGLFVISFNSKKGHRLSFKDLLAGIWEDVVRILNPVNYPMIFWIFIIFIMTGSISTFLQPFVMPEIVLMEINERIFLKFLYAGLSVGIYLVFVHRVFIYICFYHENLNYFKAKRRAKKIIDGYTLPVAVMLFLNTFVIDTATRFIGIGILNGISYIIEEVIESRLLIAFMAYIARIMGSILPYFSNVFVVLGNLILLEILYRHLTSKKDMVLPNTDFLITEPRYRRSVLSRHWGKILLVFVCVLIYYGLGNYVLLTNDFHGEARDVSVVGHRGNGNHTPENTMVAIDAAILSGVNYSEIDVQLDSEGHVLLLHDRTFKRTAGVDVTPGELSREEILMLDVGAYHSEKYAGEPVAYLEDVLEKGKGRLKFNIELKPYNNGYEELVSEVIRLVRLYNYERQCIISSTNKEAMELVQKLAPELKTGYVTPFLSGSLDALKNYDVFMLESTFVTEENIAEAHVRGQEVHVWTVNHEEDMQRLLLMDADAIITDEPSTAMVQRSIYESKRPMTRELEKIIGLY